MCQWELDLGLCVLHSIHTLQVSSLNGSGTDDLNGARATTVSASHFIVELRDSPSEPDIAELAVHVVSSRAALVTQPDTIVLDNVGVLLNNFNTVQNFTRCLLHLTELVHVVPELGLGNNSVGGKDDHTVRFWVGVIIGGGLSADHLKLFHDSGDGHLGWC